MTNRTLLFEELEEQTLEDVLQDVVRRGESLTIRMPGGDIVAIQPSQRLQDLPVLEGFVPEGWKDAVYE